MTFGFGAGVQRLGGVSVTTLAALNLISPPADTRPSGFVYQDPTPANNGVYTWSGTAWARSRGLPDGVASYTGLAGTANVITATAASGVDPAVCKVGVLTALLTNTGAVTLNGEAIKDRSGNPLSAGALAAGVSVLLLRDGGAWRLLTGNVAEISDVSGLQASLDTKIDAPTMAGAIASAISDLVGGAGAALDTLNELAAALGNDPNFATTITTTLALDTQINGATAATTVADGDHWIFRLAAGTIRKLTWANLKKLIVQQMGPRIQADLVYKATPVDADLGLLADSAASWGAKGFTLANLWANWLKGKTDALYIALTAIATAAQYRSKAAGFILTTTNAWDAAAPVNLGAALTGNLTFDLAAFIHGYGTATGNVVLNAVSNPKSQSGTFRLAASGGDRTVGFNTAAFATPGNKALKSITSGTTMFYSYFYDSILGKIVVIELGTVA